MNLNTAIFVLHDHVRAVLAEYQTVEEEKNRKLVPFKTFDQSIKVDDICVVATHTRVGFTCVRVLEVDVDIDIDHKEPIGWLAGRVDTGAFDKLKADEQAFISTMRKAQKNAERSKYKAAILETPGMEAAVKALPQLGAPAETKAEE